MDIPTSGLNCLEDRNARDYPGTVPKLHVVLAVPRRAALELAGAIQHPPRPLGL